MLILLSILYASMASVTFSCSSAAILDPEESTIEVRGETK